MDYPGCGVSRLNKYLYLCVLPLILLFYLKNLPVDILFHFTWYNNQFHRIRIEVGWQLPWQNWRRMSMINAKVKLQISIWFNHTISWYNYVQKCHNRVNTQICQKHYISVKKCITTENHTHNQRSQWFSFWKSKPSFWHYWVFIDWVKF